MKFFLHIQEFPVDSFCKGRILTPRKYIVEKGIRVSSWSEIFKSIWSHSPFFDLGQSDISGMVVPFLATFILDLSGQVSFKVATKGFFLR